MSNRRDTELATILAQLHGMLEAKGLCGVAMDEYRLWITVPDLHLEDERDWESLIEYLERWHGDLGPILTRDGRGGATVIIALDSDSEAHAARTGVGVIADALHHTGLGTRYPQLVEVERTLVEA